MGNINNFVSGLLKCSHNITENPDPQSFEMHAHDVCELYLFLNGDAKYYVEGNVYDLNKGDIMIMRQGETHKLQIEPNCIYDRVSVHFSPNIVYDSLGYEIMNPFYKHPLGRMNLYRKEDFESNFYLACCAKIKKCIDEERSNQYIIAPLLALLVEIKEAYDKKANTDSTAKHKSLAMDMVDYINKHIFEELSLEKISEHFFISSSQANRVFKKSIGSSIWEYVILKRLMTAKEMIENGESARATAEKCGFSDYSSFYRAYRKKYGASPKKR